MLEAFVAGLLLITISELGDKTFFIAVLMATRHSRLLVFIGVVAALAAMTILSVLAGNMASALPVIYVRWAEILLFLGFGIKLLIQGYRMPSGHKDACLDACQEAFEAVQEASVKLPQPTQFGLVAQAFWLTFIAEWGDRTQIATIGLAASKNSLGVTVGAILGHAICAAIAVIGGKMIAGRISEKTVTLIGGGLFLVFAAIGLAQLV
jgi:putative Ca2+/H+ antiporter (TMEM165/GDT1 family)